MTKALSIEHLSKRYHLGQFGRGTANEDLMTLWRRLRRKPIPPPVFANPDHGNRIGNDLWALRDVNIEIGEGEVIGIIGKNGSGKSTLLKIISRITAPTIGRVRVNGRLASLLEVGTGFHGELSGRENIFLNGTILGMTPSEIRRRFEEIVAFSEIEDFIDTPVKRYSSGMFVRLAFAVAAHLETDILVVDEVLAVGDIGFQRKCLGKMSDASAHGRTVLFVSHRMDHITALCSRSVVLNAGTVIFDGPTEGALSRYYGLFDERSSDALAEREDRQGRGRVRILDVWVESPAGSPVGTVSTGRSVIFKLRLKNMTGSVVRNLNAGVAIFSQSNQFIASVSTNEANMGAFHIDDEEIITLEVPKFPLNQGSYYLNCIVRSATGAYEIEDLVEAAQELSVDYGVFHKIGQSSGGMVSIEHHASVEGTQRPIESDVGSAP